MTDNQLGLGLYFAFYDNAVSESYSSSSLFVFVCLTSNIIVYYHFTTLILGFNFSIYLSYYIPFLFILYFILLFVYSALQAASVLTNSSSVIAHCKRMAMTLLANQTIF